MASLKARLDKLEAAKAGNGLLVLEMPYGGDAGKLVAGWEVANRKTAPAMVVIIHKFCSPLISYPIGGLNEDHPLLV